MFGCAFALKGSIAVWNDFRILGSVDMVAEIVLGNVYETAAIVLVIAVSENSFDNIQLMFSNGAQSRCKRYTWHTVTINNIARRQFDNMMCPTALHPAQL